MTYARRVAAALHEVWLLRCMTYACRMAAALHDVWLLPCMTYGRSPHPGQPRKPHRELSAEVETHGTESRLLVHLCGTGSQLGCVSVQGVAHED